MKPHRAWRPQLTPSEQRRGWVFFAVYVLAFPFLMGQVQRFAAVREVDLPVVEANVIYYFLSAVLLLLLLWSYFKHGFDLLLDWLPENLFAFSTGLIAAGALHLLAVRVPLPVSDPNLQNYREQFALSPWPTGVLVVVLIPLVEETLFRGLLFGSLRRYSRLLGYLIAVPAFAFYCVWQFVYTYGTLDFRYLLLCIRYLPMSLALTWCYDNGGSIWSAAALHMVINAFTLFWAVQ